MLQPQDASLPAQPGGCATCHAGLGSKPNLPPTEEDLANVDCLICHSSDYERTVVVDEEGTFSLGPVEGVDIVKAAQNVQKPTNEMCERCHLKAAGGPNYKHGDFPTKPEVDVHMAGDVQCVDCHITVAHKIAGGGYMIAQEATDVEVTCANCHTDEPHQTGASTILNQHTDRIACQTCHTPLVARDPDYPTQMTRDYTQPVLNETTGLYGPAVGKASNVIPSYFWWADHQMETPPKPIGTIDDENARITPWKPLTVTVPFDAQSNEPMYIKQGVYQVKGDLGTAVLAGVEASGQEYSGSWEGVAELMYFDINHQVAPASESLQCQDCHSEEGRLDFIALGYDTERVATLVSMASSSSDRESQQTGDQDGMSDEGLEDSVVMAIRHLPDYPIEDYQGVESCIGCHDDRHSRWMNSNHANAYSDPIFQQSWEEQGQPKYCLACHTTGFNPNTGEYAYEGVTCERCHGPYSEEHPPERVPVDRSGEICGSCHTVSFDEWETSIHSKVGTDCLSCHNVCTLETHEVGEAVSGEHPVQNIVCANCHHNVTDEFVHTTHAEAEIDCLTCHMQIGEDDIGPEGKVRTAHDFEVKAHACVDCHAEAIHGGDQMVSLREQVKDLEQLAPTGILAEAEGLRAQVVDMQKVAEGKLWQGGFIGSMTGLVMGAAFAWLWRRRSG
ncbi:MAG: hypothetical protein JXA42_09910 [Anaerolineales bacterium]|nr:hypothetical protein [Anaerolineales bacterium]